MATISVSGSKISIGAMVYKGVSIAGKTFDLEGYKGERIRVYIGNDNKLTIETRPTQKQLICELDVPTKRITSVDTGKKDELKQPIMVSKEQKLDLSGVGMRNILKEVKK